MAEPEEGIARVTGVVLAAGRSSRFGGDLPKQLYRMEGGTLVNRAACTALASKLCQIVVVTGHRAAEVEATLGGLALEVVRNPDFAAGQSTSVQAGLCNVEAEAGAAVFIPCDLPNLGPEHLDRLLEAYAETGGPIVVPTVEGRRYAPALIDRSLFAEIETITGDEGARQLFPSHEEEIVEVEFKSAEPFEDLDRASAL